MTRALIEHFRHEDSASLLDRMVKRGLLAKVRSDQGVGSPNIYRVTAKALRAAGYPTVEAMRAVIQASLSAAEQTSLASEHQEQLEALVGAGMSVCVTEKPPGPASRGVGRHAG